MKCEWLLPVKILIGFCALTVSSFSQTYTVSAKPGALNFIQGEVSINGDPVWKANLKTTFLNANDVLTVENGKAEVLLNPGAFLRVGEHSQVRMIQASLVETQLEVVSGESMIEVDDLVPGSSIAVMDHGAAATLTKPGLFRFTERSIASLDGKAEVAFGSHRVTLRSDKEVQIDDALHAGKVDLNQPDDLYAWSNTRAQYNAAASYAGSTAAYNSGGYGFSSYNSPGWYWASGFNSYMWMPGNGAFYSPFGWGFYGPGLVAYAPVTSVYLGGYYGGYYPASYYGSSGSGTPAKGPTAPVGSKPVLTSSGNRSTLTVPLNPQNVGVSNIQASRPADFVAARNEAQAYANFYGLQTARGTPAATTLRNGQTFSSMHEASRAASASAQQTSRAAAGGGWTGGGSSGSNNTAASSGVPASRSVGMGSSQSMGSMGGGAAHSGGHTK